MAPAFSSCRADPPLLHAGAQKKGFYFKALLSLTAPRITQIRGYTGVFSAGTAGEAFLGNIQVFPLKDYRISIYYFFYVEIF